MTNKAQDNKTADSSEQSRQMLVAMPSMLDPNFARGVTLLCKHDQDGAIGITINRPSNMILLEIFKQLNIECDDPVISEQTVFEGGPVRPERGFVVHTPDQKWESSLQVAEGLMVTSSRDVLAAIAAGEGPEKYLVALGYAGWSEGQLEDELRANAWLTVDADSDIIFNQDTSKRWQSSVDKLGINLNQLPNQVGSA